MIFFILSCIFVLFLLFCIFDNHTFRFTRYGITKDCTVAEMYPVTMNDCFKMQISVDFDT